MPAKPDDFLIQVEGKTFHQAMQTILALRSFSEEGTTSNDYDAAEQELREEHDNDRQILQ